MIVGVRDVPLKELEERLDDHKELSRYVVNLVPRAVRSNRTIVDNQKYIAACCLRQSKRDFYKVQAAINYLVHDVYIVGLCDVVTEFNDIMEQCDKTLIAHCLREDGLL